MPFEKQKTEGQRIADRVVKGDFVDSAQLASWIEGASDRLIRQETEIRALKFNFYMFLFFVIGVPILMRGLG